MFIRYLFFSLVFVSGINAMENENKNHLMSVREGLEEALFAMSGDTEGIETLAKEFARAVGFRPEKDEYKKGIAKNGKAVVLCKKLTKNTKQKNFHHSSQVHESETNS